MERVRAVDGLNVDGRDGENVDGASSALSLFSASHRWEAPAKAVRYP
jgi:hypothetical protein